MVFPGRFTLTRVIFTDEFILWSKITNDFHKIYSQMNHCCNDTHTYMQYIIKFYTNKNTLILDIACGDVRNPIYKYLKP